MQQDADMFTAEEAAPMLLRLSPESVRRLIRQGRIKAVKIGRRYMTGDKIERIKAEGTRGLRSHWPGAVCLISHG